MNQFILYQTKDGNSKINLTVEDGTIWLTQLQIAELFQTTKQTISKHIKNILEDSELDEKVVINYQFTATNQGKIEDGLPKRKVAHYNLDMILAIGYRMQSPRGIQFRKYASTILKEYFIKGFAIDDERFKNLGGDHYFEELLERIRNIRFSGKVFYRQLLDLFATSVDYNKDSNEAKRFFTTVRNKLHFPIHYQTPTEDWNYHIEQLLSKIDDDIEIGEKLFGESIEIKDETEQTNDTEYTLNQIENDPLRELKKIENIVKNRK